MSCYLLLAHSFIYNQFSAEIIALIHSYYLIIHNNVPRFLIPGPDQRDAPGEIYAGAPWMVKPR